MNAKILIVEDEILVGMMLQRNIEGAGVGSCEIATNGEDAIRMAGRLSPDLLLMDFSLPGTIDGIDAAEQIICNRKVPIVFFSGNNRDKELLARAQVVEPYAVLDKMDSFEKVLATLVAALKEDTALS